MAKQITKIEMEHYKTYLFMILDLMIATYSSHLLSYTRDKHNELPAFARLQGGTNKCTTALFLNAKI